MKPFMHSSLAMLLVFLLSATAHADEKQLAIYGFRLGESLEEAIANAVDKGFVVHASEIPEKFSRNSSVQQRNFGSSSQFFRICFTAFREDFGLKVEYDKRDINLVDDNLSPMASRDRLPLAKIDVDGLPERANMSVYFVKEGGATRCIFIYIYEPEGILIKDIVSVFKERYGNPESIPKPEPEPAYAHPFMSSLQEQLQKQSSRQPVEFWRVGEDYAWADFNQAYLANPGLVSRAFDMTLKEMNQILDEEEKAKREKEDAASQKRKSMM